MNHSRKPWLAAILSLLYPGLGQVYAGHLKKGLLLNVGLYLAVFFMMIGLRFTRFPAQFILSITLLAVTLLYVVGVVDAWRSSRRQPVDYALRPYNRVMFYLSFSITLSLLSGLMTTIIRANVIQAFRMPSASMEPTIQVGDFIFVAKGLYGSSSGRPGRGDIVVLPYPELPKRSFIKRVIGLPGETLEIRDRIVHINGDPIREPYVKFTDSSIRPRSAGNPNIYPSGAGNKDNYGPVTVPPGRIFVMGDNRDQSDDSRYWGFVDSQTLIGRVSVIYWSWDKNLGVRWDRIGRRLDY